MGKAGLLRIIVIAWPALGVTQAGAQTAPFDGPLRFGVIATTGPLCHLRDQAWGQDLWRATMLALGARPRSPDPAQQGLTDRVGAALSYAEDQALETFAEAQPDATCRPLAQNPDLAAADQMVAAYRAGAGAPLW